MKVTIAKTAGFCNGVNNAFTKSIEAAKNHSEIYMVGELVHNADVVKKLEENHIKLISQEDAKYLKSGLAIIKAGGVRCGLIQEMENNGVEVLDLTCPVVKRIHDIIAEQSKLGKDIILIGNPKHDEVMASVSYCSSNIEVISPSDIEKIKIGENDTIIVFQTTILPEIVNELTDFLKQSMIFSNKSFVIYNTVCYTTTKQQSDISLIGNKFDGIIVVGDSRSSNTKNLFEVAKSTNKNTYFCEGLKDIEKIKNLLKESNSIAITAGASTPKWLIEEVAQSMSEEKLKTAETKVEDTTSKVDETENLTMEDLLAKHDDYVDYRPGKRVKCAIIQITDDGLYVQLGGKKDGFISKEEASIDGTYNKEDYKIGDEVVAIIKDVKEYVNLSKKAIDAKKEADEKIRQELEGEFTVKIEKAEEKGVRGRKGSYEIFVPASQIKIGFVKNLEEYVGKELRVELLPFKKKKTTFVDVLDADGNPVLDENGEPKKEKKVEEVEEQGLPQRLPKSLVASQRVILEREKKEKEDDFWNNIHVNDIVTGKVKRYTSFGAFVSVRGYDCLAHVSELSWNKTTDPSKVVELNKDYDFVVLKLDRQSGKISLGYKQLQKKPYEIAAETYPVGTVIKGVVERIFPYGAFISIADGVDGLVHVSQISHNWIKDANEALTVGQEVEAKIIGFDDNRITLSIKELLPPPEVKEEAQATEENATEEKKPAKRSKKSESKVEEGAPKKTRAAKKEKDDEPKEWVSGDSSTSFGDLLKGLDLPVDEK